MRWRPRIRFRLATLLSVITALCVWLGVTVDRAHKQRRAVETVARLDGAVMFDYQFEPRGDIEGEMDLRRLPPGPVWARKLLGDDYFRTVVGLTIDGHEQSLDTVDLNAVCGLRGLKLLFVRKFAIDDAELGQVSRLPKLEVLNLGSAALTDDSLQKIARARRLKSLTLSRTRVTDAGLVHLAQITSLARLDLSGTKIKGAGLTYLSQLPALEELSLAETKIDDGSVPFLQHLRQLKQLDLWRTAISDAAAKQLQASLPGCGIIWSR